MSLDVHGYFTVRTAGSINSACEVTKEAVDVQESRDGKRVTEENKVDQESQLFLAEYV